MHLNIKRYISYRTEYVPALHLGPTTAHGPLVHQFNHWSHLDTVHLSWGHPDMQLAQNCFILFGWHLARQFTLYKLDFTFTTGFQWTTNILKSRKVLLYDIYLAWIYPVGEKKRTVPCRSTLPHNENQRHRGARINHIVSQFLAR